MDGGAVRLRGGDCGCDGAVGAQDAGVGVEDGAVVGAEVVLRVAFGHLFAAEDFVVGSVAAGCFEQASEIGAVPVPMDRPPQRVRICCPVSASSSAQSRGSARGWGSSSAFRGTACGTGGCHRPRRCGRGRAMRLESDHGVGQPGSLPQGHASDAAQADDGEFSVHVFRAPVPGNPGSGVPSGWQGPRGHHRVRRCSPRP